MTTNEKELPEIHTGTIIGVSTMMSGIQTLTFNDHTPVSIENYGVRQLFTASEHLGLPNPIGMRIEFSMDESLGILMNTFQIIGSKTYIACYQCQKVIPRKNKSEYATCEECGHVYCHPCEEENCPFCEITKPVEVEKVETVSSTITLTKEHLETLNKGVLIRVTLICPTDPPSPHALIIKPPE